MESAFDAARMADMPSAVPDLHDVGQAGIIVREPGKKLPHREPAKLL